MYRLRCRTFESQDQAQFDYSGDFECRLFVPRARDWRSGWNLLSDVPEHKRIEDYRDWDHRGRFLALQLTPSCLKYPDYGATRVFKLRGMRLVLSLDTFVLDVAELTARATNRRPRPAIKSFTLAVRVTPDSSATSRYARRVRYEEPSCVRRSDTRCVELDCAEPRRSK